MKVCTQCRYFYHGHKNEPSLCTNKKSKRFPHNISKNGHNHICALFRPPKSHNPSVDLVKPVAKKKNGYRDHHHQVTGTLAEYKGRLRYIESLRGIYSGREIWIFATGRSLDDIPDDFLAVDETVEPDENGNRPPKVSITVKEAGIGFPNSTYNMWAFRDRSLRRKYLPKRLIPNNFKRFIFTIFKSNRENYFGNQSPKATYLKFYQGGTLGIMKNVCDSIITGNSSIYCGITTITHLAIEAAIVLGASRVSLVGCDRGCDRNHPDGKFRAQKRGMTQGYGWDSPDQSGYELQIPGFDFLGDYFRNHGIEIARYFQGKGYVPVGEVMEVKNAE